MVQFAKRGVQNSEKKCVSYPKNHSETEGADRPVNTPLNPISGPFGNILHSEFLQDIFNV